MPQGRGDESILTSNSEGRATYGIHLPSEEINTDSRSTPSDLDTKHRRYMIVAHIMLASPGVTTYDDLRGVIPLA